MKRCKIRKWSVLWWMREAVGFVSLAIVVWGVEFGMLALYAQEHGLPMPWEGLI